MSNKSNVFSNIGRSMGAISEIIVSTPDLAELNIDSLNQLSVAGNVKAEIVAASSQLNSGDFNVYLDLALRDPDTLKDSGIEGHIKRAHVKMSEYSASSVYEATVALAAMASIELLSNHGDVSDIQDAIDELIGDVS